MNLIDYLLIAVIVVAVHHAMGRVIKNKGGCCGDCSGCASKCKKREENFHETD